MKILILGHGAVGSVLARLLKKEKTVKTVISADLHFKEEKKFGKMHHVKINLTDKSQLSDILEKHRPDLVINASSPKFNSDILDECAKAGINYMDLAACWEESPDKNACEKLVSGLHLICAGVIAEIPRL